MPFFILPRHFPINMRRNPDPADEETLTGRIMGENDQSIQLRQNPYSAQVISIEKVRLAKRETSSVSPMPEGLIDVLSREEVFDLLAYLNAGGNRQDPAFSK